MGYAGIYFMMVLESSFFPFPSEIAMVPAGYLSSQWEMNFAIAFAAGTFWAITWACINYLIWLKLWWPLLKKIIEKYGKYVFLTLEHYNKTEYYFLDHGSAATFLWRLVTWIRQIISLPAGVFKMNFWKFLFYTWVWAWLWNLVLMVIWYIAGENKELIAQYSFVALIISLAIVWFSWYLYFQRRKYPIKIKTSSLIYLDKDNKILIDDIRDVSEHWNNWALFGWIHAYGEKPKKTVIREIKEKLGLDITDTVKYAWYIKEKLPERHTIVKRSFYYIHSGTETIEAQHLSKRNSQFIQISDIAKTEGFYLQEKAQEKLQKIITKVREKVSIERAKELQRIKDEESI